MILVSNLYLASKCIAVKKSPYTAVRHMWLGEFSDGTENKRTHTGLGLESSLCGDWCFITAGTVFNRLDDDDINVC